MKKVLITTFILIILIFSFIFICSCEDKKEQENNNSFEQKINLNDENTILDKDSFVYDGSEKTPKIKILKNNELYCELTASNDEFDIAYFDNIEVGSAYVRIQACDDNKYFKGSINKYFTIKEMSIIVTTQEQLKSALLQKSAKIQVTDIKKIDSNLNLTIDSSLTLIFETNALIENFAEITNNGVLIIKGKDTRFNNKATINNNGEISIEEEAKLFNLSNIDNKGKVNLISSGKLISNQYLEKMSGKTQLNGYYVRSNLEYESFTTNKKKYEYTGKKIEPSITTGVLSYDYDIRYENNIDVSNNAKVYITAKEDSLRYYGSKELTFSIISPTIIVKATDSTNYLMTLLNNPNYQNITIYGTRNFDGVTIYKDVVINLKALSYIVDENPNDDKNGLTNYGKIINEQPMVVDSGTLNNQGEIENKSAVHIENNNLLEGNAINNTAGEIFVKENLQGYTQNVFLKEVLTESKLNCEFDRQAGFSTGLEDESWKFAYNGQDQYPKITFTNSQVLENTYNIKRYKSENGQEVYIPNTSKTYEIGEYRIEIACEKYNKYYYGSFSHSYSILETIVSYTQGVVEFSPQLNSNLEEILDDPGYKKVIMGYEFSTINEEINAEIIVDENGKWIINNNCNISKNVTNRGTIIQGCFLDQDKNTQTYTVQLSNNAQVTNFGTIYTNEDNNAPWVEGENVYHRKNINDTDCHMIDINYENEQNTTIFYGDDNNTPGIVLKINGEEKNVNNNCRLDYSTRQYGANTLWVVAKKDSQIVFGSKKLTYYIKKGIIEVNSAQALYNALNSKNKQDECNYGKIIIGRIDSTVYSFKISRNITIPYGVVLDMSNAIIQHETSVNITNDGIIIINKEVTHSDFLVNNKGRGSAVALINSLDELRSLMRTNFNYTEIVLTANIEGNEQIDSNRQSDIIIYKNNFTISDGIVINPRNLSGNQSQFYEITWDNGLSGQLSLTSYYWS